MSENVMSILDPDVPKRSQLFLNILNKPEKIREKKRRVVLNPFTERNLNVLLKLCHRMLKSKRCKLIRNVLRPEEKNRI
jgi:hypothetical protein